MKSKAFIVLAISLALALTLANADWLGVCKKPKTYLKFNLKEFNLTTKWFVYQRSPKPEDKYRKCMTISVLNENDQLSINYTSKTYLEFYYYS